MLELGISSKKIKFSGTVWLYSGSAGWHFVTLGEKTSSEVKSFIRGDSSAWGSVKVLVKVKDHEWQTSIFPDRKLGSYLLPLRKAVRKALKISEGTKVLGTLKVTRDDDLLS